MKCGVCDSFSASKLVPKTSAQRTESSERVQKQTYRERFRSHRHLQQRGRGSILCHRSSHTVRWLSSNCCPEPNILVRSELRPFAKRANRQRWHSRTPKTRQKTKIEKAHIHIFQKHTYMYVSIFHLYIRFVR